MKKVNKVLGVYYFNPTGVSTNPDNMEWKQKEETEVKNKYRELNGLIGRDENYTKFFG